MGDLSESSNGLSLTPPAADAVQRGAAPHKVRSSFGALQTRCIQELFETQVARTPDAWALIHQDEQVSYAALNQRANQLARYLQKQGVGPESLVCICVERSIELLVGLLGILKAGGAYVPLDPAYPRQRWLLIVADTKASLILTQAKFAAGFSGCKSKIVSLDADWIEIEKEIGANTRSTAGPDNLAYVIYTSGSTGRPKGVMVRHSSLVNYSLTASADYGLQSNDRILQFASITFDASAEEIYPCLISGAGLVLRTDEMLGSARLFLQRCREWAITVLDLPTAYWHELTATIAAENLTLPPSLRLIIIGGERALPERLATWRKSLDQNVRLVNTYGPTEATIVATSCDLTQTGVVSDSSLEVPIGRAVRGSSTFVLDQNLELAAEGTTGELYIGGQGLARGYFEEPVLTAEKFIPHCFSKRPGERLYKTGDLASRLTNGLLVFQGRIDDQVKVRGFRVELGEIETVLRRLPGLRDVVVLAREDVPGDKRLVAYVVPEREHTVTISQLREHAKKILPNYMVPALFIFLDALPLTPSGKVARGALPAPDKSRAELGVAFVAPSTPAEKRLAKLWAMVLGLEHLGVHDNFFELGGDSLRAIQLLTRVRENFQLDLPALTIFDFPTIAELAESIDRIGEDRPRFGPPPIRPAPRIGPLPVSFPQQVVWLLSQMSTANLAYSTQLSIRFKGKLDQVVLHKTLTEIVRRHEIFRTTFETVDNQPVQVIHSPRTFELPLLDLSGLNFELGEAEAEKFVLQECLRPFDITRLPLVRWSLLRVHKEDHILVQVEHHLVHDGWSLALLLREIKALYEAFSSNRPSPLPDLPVQFADYAVWQREWLRGETLEALLVFWKKHLAGCPPLLDLPADRSRPKVQSFRGGALVDELPPSLCKALRSLSQQHGVTLFMTMLAAFQILLSRYTGQDDMVIGSSVANRQLRETENLIGMIVNTVVLRIDLSGNPKFVDFLERVRQSALQTYAHQEMPFEKLVEALQPVRELSYNPLFQVMFNFHDSYVPELTLEGLQGTLQYRQNRSSKFDLNIVVIPHFAVAEGLSPLEGNERLLIEWEYSTDLFDEVTMKRMFGCYQTLLKAIVAEPDQRILDLPMLTSAEEHQLLVEWNIADQHHSGRDRGRQSSMGETAITRQTRQQEEQLVILRKLEQFSDNEIEAELRRRA